jgi:hypothetical protein
VQASRYGLRFPDDETHRIDRSNCGYASESSYSAVRGPPASSVLTTPADSIKRATTFGDQYSENKDNFSPRSTACLQMTSILPLNDPTPIPPRRRAALGRPMCDKICDVADL